MKGEMDLMFPNRTVYDRRALACLCRALRKVMTPRLSLVLTALGTLVVAILLVMEGVLRWLDIPPDWLDFNIFLLSVLWGLFIAFRDTILGWISVRMNLTFMREVEAVFDETGYVLSVPGAEGRWEYSRIAAFCETKECFLFLLDKRHGQIFSKAGFSADSPEAFRAFITEKTGLSPKAV